MSLVIDSSVAVAWIYHDERDDYVEGILSRLTQEIAWVPAIWRLEVANALQIGIRRGRISASLRDAAFVDLGRLNIMVDSETDAFAWTDTLRLADEHRLTTYDASYLELARRRHLPLATLDRDLGRAAAALGLAFAHPRP
jgi:predicted nucleic acid-binding protein